MFIVHIGGWNYSTSLPPNCLPSYLRRRTVPKFEKNLMGLAKAHELNNKKGGLGRNSNVPHFIQIDVCGWVLGLGVKIYV